MASITQSIIMLDLLKIPNLVIIFLISLIYYTMISFTFINDSLDRVTMYPLVILIGLLDRVIMTKRVFIKSAGSVGQSIS